MLVFVETTLQEIPEIRETEAEKGKPFTELRELYINYAKTHFQGKKYRNKVLDEDILVSRDGIDKMEGMLSFREQCLAVQLLDIFLSGSTVEGRESDKKKRWNVDEFIYLTCRCNINDKPYEVRTTVKRTVNNPLKWYGFILIDIIIEATRR
jgi:hypothetical protein